MHSGDPRKEVQNGIMDRHPCSSSGTQEEPSRPLIASQSGNRHLEESEEQYRLLVTQMTQGLAVHEVVLDESGSVIDYRFIDLNKAFETLTGLNREEIIGKTVLEVLPETEHFWIQKYGHVAMTGEPLLFEHYSEALGKYYEVSAYSPKPKQFATIFSDITERREMALQLQQNNDDLLASQKIAHLGTWRLDLATNNVVWSKELYKMYGFDPTVPPPPYTEHMKLFTPESWSELSRALEKTRTTGDPYELVLELVAKDGSNGWMWVRGEAVKDSSGNITNLWGAAQDISERIQSEKALQKMNDELIANGEELEAMNEEIRASLENLETAHQELATAKQLAEDANVAKSQFLANMSHEIRTPMNGFMGMLQLLQITDLTEEQRRYTEIAKKSANTLLVLVNDILDYSRIEAGKMELDEKCFSLQDLINEVITLFRVSADAAGLVLEATVENDIPPQLCGDPFRLKQILSNLVGNAVKFTKEGHVHIVVKDMKEQHNGHMKLRFMVKDTGIGIPPDKVGLLFKRFSQADNSTTREYGGSGLGLSICKGLVEKMGGEIWVETMEGKGSCFFFTCPFEKAAAPEVHKPLSAIQVDDQRRTKILLAEDDEVSRILFENIANREGWAVSLTKNGKEAVDLFKQERFDLVLMDVQMPIMNGYEAAGRFRGLERSKDAARTPIVALTAFSIKGDREKCLEAGMDDYMSKPVNLDELHKMVSKWTEKH